MALVPPPNGAGVQTPPLPATPPTLVDITNANEYVDTLSLSKRTAYPGAASNAEIGAAEVYKAAIVFSHRPDENVAPVWLANLHAMVQNINTEVGNMNARLAVIQNDVAVIKNDVAVVRNDVAFLRRHAEEMHILLANSRAGPHEPPITPLSPNECIASALNMGLPPLPPGTPVAERRRQIARRIGVTYN
ncbi:hypothetical protein F5148DRAFT_1283922 [Russula earlei]|uniref:Uncharacterized protein n=1 Tax=Russula earlei TaxID=71964 RepID=A0ACC0UB29_9AGAM|nr:hypothetical protein F5148DRAFT_1283922 [Russula earlei]